MTVSNPNERMRYVGDGTVATYAFTFRIFTTADLQVWKRTAAGVLSQLTLTTDYTVTGAGVLAGGTITLVAGVLASLDVLVILRVLPLTQLMSVRSFGPTFQDIEDEFDRDIMVAQQLQDTASRSLRLPIDEAGTDALCAIPILTDRASNFFAWDAAGQPMAAAGSTPGTVPVSGFMATVLDDVNGAAALATLVASASAQGARDAFGGLPHVVTNLAALRALATTNLAGIVYVQGNTTVGDGGEGMFRWVGADATADDSGTIIAPTVGAGRWFRIYSGPVNVRWFGGLTSAAINLACAAAVASGSKEVFAPAGTYVIIATIALAASVRLFGLNKRTTKFQKGANCDMVTMADSSMIEGIYLDGVGATWTGKGVVIAATSGGQTVQKCVITDMDDYAIEFADNLAGSRSVFYDLELGRHNGSGAGRYAVHIPTTATLTAVPRKFIAIETLGLKFIAIGGCNDLLIGQSFVGELLFDANSRGVLIVGSRIGVNETAMALVGFGVNLIGCDVAPAITVGAGTVPWAVEGCTLNNPLVDNSGTTAGLADTYGVVYTPVWTGAAANPILGNGSLRGYFARVGSVVKVDIELTIGGTTNVNACGVMRFSLPQTPIINNGAPAPQLQVGSGYVLQAAGATVEFVQPLVLPNIAYVTLQRAGAGGLRVTDLAPWAWAAGDIIRISITYQI